MKSDRSSTQMWASPPKAIFNGNCSRKKSSRRKSAVTANSKRLKASGTKSKKITTTELPYPEEEEDTLAERIKIYWKRALSSRNLLV